jgi:hypothetical protein
MSLFLQWMISSKLILLCCPGWMPPYYFLQASRGAIDAIGCLKPGQVLTANMTGNTILMGVSIGQGKLVHATRAFVAPDWFYHRSGHWSGNYEQTGKRMATNPFIQFNH